MSNANSLPVKSYTDSYGVDHRYLEYPASSYSWGLVIFLHTREGRASDDKPEVMWFGTQRAALRYARSVVAQLTYHFIVGQLDAKGKCR